jgi:hypothetical protein
VCVSYLSTFPTSADEVAQVCDAVLALRAELDDVDGRASSDSDEFLTAVACLSADFVVAGCELAAGQESRSVKESGVAPSHRIDPMIH